MEEIGTLINFCDIESSGRHWKHPSVRDPRWGRGVGDGGLGFTSDRVQFSLKQRRDMHSIHGALCLSQGLADPPFSSLPWPQRLSFVLVKMPRLFGGIVL